MKKIILYFGVAVISAVAVTVSCDKEQNGSAATVLETPVVEISESTDTSFTVSWAAIENAVSYTYLLNSSTTASTTETTVEFHDLKAGKYTFTVRAVAGEESGLQDSEWSIPVEYTVTASDDPDDDPDNPDDDPDDPIDPKDPITKWVGTYDLTSSATVEFYYNEAGGVSYRKLDEPMSKQIQIRESEYYGEVEIYGLSAVSDDYFAVARERTVNGVSGLGLVLDEVLYTNGAAWLGIYETEDGRMGIRPGLDMGFFFVEKDGVITSTPRKGEFTSDGTVFYVIACDLFSMTEDGNIGLYYKEWPAHLPAGDITLEKVETGGAVVSSEPPALITTYTIYNN